MGFGWTLVLLGLGWLDGGCLVLLIVIVFVCYWLVWVFGGFVLV